MTPNVPCPACCGMRPAIARGNLMLDLCEPCYLQWVEDGEPEKARPARIHACAAAALGWSIADTRSFSLPSLASILRGKDDALVDEIRGIVKRGEHITGEV